MRKKLEKETSERNSLDKAVNVPATSDATTSDDTIIKEGKANKKQKLYFMALDRAVKVATTKNEAISNIHLINNHFNVQILSYLYGLASKMKTADKYNKVASFISMLKGIMVKS